MLTTQPTNQLINELNRQARAESELKREICSIWGSDEIRRQKPTPQIEARGGMAIVETVGGTHYDIQTLTN